MCKSTIDNDDLIEKKIHLYIKFIDITKLNKI